MKADNVILGNGKNCVFSSDSQTTGLNNNILVCGSSGCGKTMSVSEARLLETKQSSLILTVTKRRIINKYKNLMRNRRYQILDLDFVHPENGNTGYDPLEYINSYQDITFLARSIVLSNPKKADSKADPYWDDAAVSLLSAEIAFTLMTKKEPTFEDVLSMHEHLNFTDDGSQVITSYDEQFEQLENCDPSCFAVSCFKSFKRLPSRTASCIFGTLNTAIDSIFTPELRRMFSIKKKVHFEQLATRKTVLFITSSPVNPALNCFINTFYGHVFKQLFEFAEKQPDGTLPIPVHVLADDFATGCPIQQFPEYISIFREKKISVTLLIQSESQLASLYGLNDATTIINNCDSYLYMGSMDLMTAKNISLRANRPLEDILYMPVGSEILFRRGQKPIFTERYDIRSNELYQIVTHEYQKQLKSKTGRLF